MNEAETTAEHIDPALAAAGWGVVDGSRVRREYPITLGRIEGHGRRGKALKADYVLEYRNTKLATVEAKAWDEALTEGVGQTKDYATRLANRYTYATNGQGIYGVDMKTGHEAEVPQYPTPDELWSMTFAEQNAWRDRFAAVPFEDRGGYFQGRYYQDIAIERVLEFIAAGKDRILLTLATGTGKTFVAFQIAWKLFQSRWSLSDWKSDSEPTRRPRILFLADRNLLAKYVDTPDDVIMVGEVEAGKRYTESDFNKIIEIEEREAHRVKLFMDQIDQREKTLVFCASQDNDKTIPTILTTSQKLSTGVDARNVRNIVLIRPINSMIEFKQIIGRGTRLYDGKDYFTIYDFVKAHHHFSDPEWDGEPQDPEACPSCGQRPCVCETPEPKPCPDCGKLPEFFHNEVVLAHCVSEGVEELDQKKLTPLLRLKYHDSLSDAIADLGRAEDIGRVFVGLQKYLYLGGA